jgi:hypothetical protein
MRLKVYSKSQIIYNGTLKDAKNILLTKVDAYRNNEFVFEVYDEKGFFWFMFPVSFSSIRFACSNPSRRLEDSEHGLQILFSDKQDHENFTYEVASVSLAAPSTVTNDNPECSQRVLLVLNDGVFLGRAQEISCERIFERQKTWTWKPSQVSSAFPGVRQVQDSLLEYWFDQQDQMRLGIFPSSERPLSKKRQEGEPLGDHEGYSNQRQLGILPFEVASKCKLTFHDMGVGAVVSESGTQQIEKNLFVKVKFKKKKLVSVKLILTNYPDSLSDMMRIEAYSKIKSR